MAEERLFNRNFLLVLAGNFLLFFAFFTILPVLPLYMQETYNATHTEIGVVLSLYTVTALIIRPFAGFMLDSLPRRPMQLIFYGAFALIFCTYIIPGGVVLFAILRALHGLIFGFITVANSTVAIDVLHSSRRNEGIGYYGISNNLGMALGPTISFATYNIFGSYDALFLCAFIACALGFLMVSLVKMPQKAQLLSERPKQQPISLDRFFLVKGIHESITFMLLSFSYGILSTYLAVYARDEVGIENSTGPFFMLMALGLISARISNGPHLRKDRVIQLVTAGMLGLFIGYAIFIFVSNEIIFYASAYILGFSYGMICPTVQTMFVNLAPNNRRSTANSTYLTSWDVGVGIGVVIGGAIADVHSYRAAYILGVVLIALALIQFRKVAAPYFIKNRLR